MQNILCICSERKNLYMKVLHINCNYITTALHQTMIETLEKAGVENTVFAPTYNKKIAVIQPNDNVLVSECFKKLDRLYFFRKQKKIIQSIEKLVDMTLHDCIHAYTVFTDGNCAMELAKKYHRPYVVAVRDTDVNCFFKYMPHLRKKGIEILKSASAIFFLSPSYKKTVFEKYVPEEMREELLCKTYVIPNGINDFWFQNDVHKDYFVTEKRFRHKEVKAIYVGRISRRKNITSTQKALALLREEGWNTDLAVVGGVDEIREYRRIVKDKNTRYLPKKVMDELVEIYKKYDMFIMPSHTETFGLVYAEAMSQGLPVVYTRNQGFDGQFPEGYVGYSVNDKDVESIANAVKNIAKKYEEISKNAMEGAKKFKWEDICEIYKKIYSNIVSIGPETI